MVARSDIEIILNPEVPTHASEELQDKNDSNTGG
jgi:hypothetical protein